jgi:Ribonuclease G/E
MKEQTPITAEDFLNTKKVLPYQDKFTEGHTLEIMEQYAQAKVLEALEEVDKYCDGKVRHFSKAPMDLQGIHATREVKTYLNILRNRSKTKV